MVPNTLQKDTVDTAAFPDKLGAEIGDDGVKFDHYPIEETLVFKAHLLHGSHLECILDLGNGVILDREGKQFTKNLNIVSITLYHRA